ncbi:MAG TPA: TadE/TadG family type IV pilus assembly protein [Lacipirellulaceae bacterium]|nr:TadE/TadG family type IV pilus assembly protein [Lacipirellulaceae bacterium]
MRLIRRSNRLGSNRKVPARRLRSRGVAAAELAVCLPVVVLLVLATIESCSAIFLKQSLTVAAYEGVRTAIERGATATNVQSICDQILSDRRIKGSKVSVDPSDIASLSPGDYVNVTITAPCARNSPVPPVFFRGKKLTTTASMMIEN